MTEHKETIATEKKDQGVTLTETKKKNMNIGVN